MPRSPNYQTVRFSDGNKCPILGFGTARLSGEECFEIVNNAIAAGYRHFDCAHLYRNENEIGRAICSKIKDTTVEREELFVTGKLWNSFHRVDMVMPALERTLDDLGLNYLDLYLIHWPMAFKDGWEMNLKDSTGRVQYSDAEFTDTWKIMEAAVEEGLVRSIGVSNFNKEQIERIFKTSCIKPVTNQVECHPYLNQTKLLEFCRSEDIVLTGYRVVGPTNDSKTAFHDPLIVHLASKYDKSPAQVLIRYQIQRGIIALTKTTSKAHMRSNLDVFEFELDNNDIDAINRLNKGRAGRQMDVPYATDHRNYPFHSDF